MFNSENLSELTGKKNKFWAYHTDDNSREVLSPGYFSSDVSDGHFIAATCAGEIVICRVARPENEDIVAVPLRAFSIGKIK